jgi:hypothetical protein
MSALPPKAAMSPEQAREENAHALGVRVNDRKVEFAGIYNRTKYIDEMRAALLAIWAFSSAQRTGLSF